MTETELDLLIRSIAPVIREYVTTATSAITPRVAAIEARLVAIGDLRDRVVTVETKATSLPELATDLGQLRERVAVLDARPPVAGPAGPPGLDGKDGAPGTPGLSFEGVYQEGQPYEKGQLVTWAGSSWHCNAATTTKPGDGSHDWTLMVKRGRDGKDGQAAPALPVVAVRKP